MVKVGNGNARFSDAFVLYNVVMVLERCNGPRRLRDHDDDDLFEVAVLWGKMSFSVSETVTALHLMPLHTAE